MITAPLIVVSFIMVCLTSLMKQFIIPKYGSTGVHVFLFILAAVYTICTGLFSVIPSLKVVIEQGLIMLGTAITMYEVLLSKFGFS